MIRVIVLDDHVLVRQGVRSVLDGDPLIEIVGEGGSGEELETLVRDLTPDVVLLDLEMPQCAGSSARSPGNTFRAFPAITWITANYPETKVLVVSQYLDLAILEGTAKAGVAGYILKDDGLSQFLNEAVRAVSRGGFYFSKATSLTLRQMPEMSLSDTIVLTPRQKEILEFIIMHPNLTYAEQAALLYVSENTLRNHLKAIFERLAVNNLTAAVIRALQARIIDTSCIDISNTVSTCAMAL